MSYELKAIIEYDAARLEIIHLGNEISKSTSIYDSIGMAVSRKCTESDDNQCFERLWAWNKQKSLYEQWEKYCYEEDYVDPPDGEEPPELCECCKITQQLIDDRKAAKKRFGIAKTRLSRIARDHRNSTVLCVDEI